MKIISWNVNGIRACVNKGLHDFIYDEQPDIFCVQETKMQKGQADISFDGYIDFWNSADKKGYSGTAIFTKEEPISISYDIGVEAHSHEGRVITAEYNDFYLVTAYTPNAQRELARIDYRMDWEDCFRAYLVELDKKKPVIICGDLNVAHNEIDLKNAKANVGNAGFSNEERGKFNELLDAGFIDTFRYFYPDKADIYTWWSYMFKARQNNAGWRIDYFLASKRFMDRVQDSLIYDQVLGSDHCPVGLLIK